MNANQENLLASIRVYSRLTAGKEEPLMNANERELILKDEVYQIVGAAMEVSNQLGCGFLEAVHQEALEIELDERRIPHMPQKRVEISYKGACPLKVEPLVFSSTPQVDRRSPLMLRWIMRNRGGRNHES